ncbi:MAG: tyrosine-type recombinase/integrase [Oscillospiraceae bacterium]
MSQSKASGRKSVAGMGSIRKKEKVINGKAYTYYEARYTVGIDPGTGKQIQKSISGKTQREVTRRLKEITTSIDTGTYLPSCKLTVGEWLNTWISEYTADWKPLTVSNYSKQIKKHLIPRLSAAKLEDLDTHTIQLFYNSLTKSGLAPKTVKNIHGVLHAALEQAISNGYIHKNPTAGCKLPKVVRPEIKPLEPEEIARMLKEAKKDAYDNLFIVAMFTGMRQGELLGLSWDNVNFKTGRITIKQQLQCKDGVYFLETPKSGKCRVLSPAPVVMEALKDEQQQQNANKQIVGAAWENKFNLVFTDALGKNLVRRTVVKHFKAVIERANIPPDVRFHDLRHSFAVTSLYSGDDVKTVQANLGHATAQFTLDVYGHVTQKMRQESAMRMQAFYNHLEV